MAFSSDPSLQSNQVSVSIDFPDVDSPNFKETLSLDRKRIADAINTKEGALYSLKEQSTFQQYYTVDQPYKFRNVYRTVVNFGALPNAGVKTLAHGIPFNSQYRITRLYGASTDPINLRYIPLPFVSNAPANAISLELDGTNIIVASGINRNNYTSTSIVIEYTKNPEA